MPVGFSDLIPLFEVFAIEERSPARFLSLIRGSAGLTTKVEARSARANRKEGENVLGMINSSWSSANLFL
jgi:hypothetical protein